MKIKTMITVICVIIIFAVAYFGFVKKPEKPNTPQGSNTQQIVKNPEESTEPTADDKDYGDIGFDLMRQESLGVLKDGMSAVEVINNIRRARIRLKAVEWGADDWCTKHGFITKRASNWIWSEMRTNKSLI